MKKIPQKISERTLWITLASLVVTIGATLAVLYHKPIVNAAKRLRPRSNPAAFSRDKWKAALQRTKEALKDKDLAASAAALAYYTTLSFFPVLLGVASLYIYIAGSGGILHILSGLQHVMPAALYETIRNELMPLTKSSSRKALFALIISIIALLWTTSGGVQNLVRATNKAYEVKEDRGFLKLRLISVVFGVLFLVVGGIILGLLLLQPSAFTTFGWPHSLAILLTILRFPILIVLVSLILSSVYRYGPNRKEPYWQWVSWGATAATVLWLVATILFFLYVQYFGSYAKTYGIFAGLIVLMVWFNVSSLIILLGAQVNKKLEEVSPAPTQ